MSELEDIWHRTPEERHSDDMRELRAELAQARAELAAAIKERDNWKAHAISRGKRLRRMYDKFGWICRELEDEGDRVYFGSSNHADDFKEAIARLDDFKWSEVMGEPENWDLVGALEKALAELAAANAVLASVHGRIRLIEKLAGTDPLIIEECRKCVARIDAVMKGRRR